MDKKKANEEEKKIEDAPLVPIFIMGKRYIVPESLTIQKALEHAGYQLIRGCGCRGGICGACGTVYRFPSNFKIEVGLACQTVVQPNMYITQIPFFPANKALYDIEKLEPKGETITQMYPEVFKCMGCNTCTKSCPMDIEVMEYISAALRGDIAKAAELSFSCVMCGLCTARCPGELSQYNIGILCRRLYGKYIAPKAKHIEEQIEKINKGVLEEPLRKLMSLNEQELKKRYEAREIEPEIADEYWTPKERNFL